MAGKNRLAKMGKGCRRLMRAAAVRERYGGWSEMTLWRKIKKSSFPPPSFYLDGVRYWDEAVLDRNDDQLAEEAERQRVDDVAA